MNNTLKHIQRDPTALAAVIAKGMTSIRGMDGEIEQWRVEQCFPMAETVVGLLARERAERAGRNEPTKLCRGKFSFDAKSSLYKCAECGLTAGPMQFAEIRACGFGAHYWDHDSQRLRFDVEVKDES